MNSEWAIGILGIISVAIFIIVMIIMTIKRHKKVIKKSNEGPQKSNEEYLDMLDILLKKQSLQFGFVFLSLNSAKFQPKL